MENFFVKYIDGKIIINSNTYWHTTIKGNFTLSQYSGEGDSEIEIIIPSDISHGIGEVTFSYGNNYCVDKPKIYINKENDKYFKIVPDYVCLTGKNSTALVTIFSNNEFKLERSDNKYYTVLPFNRNKLLVISNTNDNFGCNGDVKVFINDLLKPNKATLKIYQCLEKETEKNCILYANYSQINDNTYHINVESLYNGHYALFTWDEINNAIITKINANTLSLTLNDNLDDTIKLSLHNKCDNFDLIITKEIKQLTTIFDIAVPCNGVIGRKGGEINLSILSKTVSLNENYNEILEENRRKNFICNNKDN